MEHIRNPGSRTRRSERNTVFTALVSRAKKTGVWQSQVSRGRSRKGRTLVLHRGGGDSCRLAWGLTGRKRKQDNEIGYFGMARWDVGEGRPEALYIVTLLPARHGDAKGSAKSATIRSLKMIHGAIIGSE